MRIAKKIDPEVSAISKIIELLEPLDAQAQMRILMYVGSRPRIAGESLGKSDSEVRSVPFTVRYSPPADRLAGAELFEKRVEEFNRALTPA